MAYQPMVYPMPITESDTTATISIAANATASHIDTGPLPRIRHSGPGWGAADDDRSRVLFGWPPHEELHLVILVEDDV
jgi:hypothetical protein